MLRSIDGLAARQLRTRPLRAAAHRLRRRARRRHGVRRAAARRHDPPHVRRPDRLGLGQDRPHRHGTEANGDAARSPPSTACARCQASATPAPMDRRCVHAARRARPRGRRAAPGEMLRRGLRPRRARRRSTSAGSRAGSRARAARSRSSATGPARAISARRPAPRRHADRAGRAARRRHLPLLRATCPSVAGLRGDADRRDPSARRHPDGLPPGQRRARRTRRSVEAVQQRLARALGSGRDRSRRPQGFGDEVKQQLNGLNLVLYFFSGVALFVGGFLILNSFNMTVLQRMREIGTLRTLGASRGLRHADDPDRGADRRRAGQRARPRARASASRRA